MSEFIRLQANGEDAFPDASSQNTYRDDGTSVESALVNLESNVTTLGGVAGEAKTLAEQNSVKIATAEQEISDINSSLEWKILFENVKPTFASDGNVDYEIPANAKELLFIATLNDGVYQISSQALVRNLNSYQILGYYGSTNDNGSASFQINGNKINRCLCAYSNKDQTTSNYFSCYYR